MELKVSDCYTLTPVPHTFAFYRKSPMHPGSLLGLWRYIKHFGTNLITYLLTYKAA